MRWVAADEVRTPCQACIEWSAIFSSSRIGHIRFFESFAWWWFCRSILAMMHSLKIIMVRHSVNSCNMSMVDEEARWERLMAGNLNCRHAKHALDVDLLHFRNPLHFISPRLHLRSQQFLTFWTSLWWLTTGTMISHKAFEAVAINHGTSMIYHIACLSISEYSLDPGWRTTARRNTKGLHSTDLRPRSFKQLLSNRLWDQRCKASKMYFLLRTASLSCWAQNQRI